MSTEIALPPKAVEIQTFLKKRVGDLAKACPKHLNPERMIQVASLLMYRNPALAECDPTSLLSSVVQASSLGLDISPSMGEAYLIPRWNSKARINEVQFQPGYRGLVKLARQAGKIGYIQAEIVREKDVFRAYRDPDWKIVHEPYFGKDGGEVTHYYAIAKLAGGEYQLCVLAKDEVDDIRRRSQSANSGPWVTDYNEMAKKTVLRRLCKGLPTSADPAAADALAAAIDADDAQYADFIAENNKPAKPNNNTGYGHGMYASPEKTAEFLKKMDGYIEMRNAKWLDRWTANGEAPKGVQPVLCNQWQADNHLIKWAVATGRLAEMDTSQGAKAAQRGKFTAVVYHRSPEDQKALGKELAKYMDEQERLAMDKLSREHPELFEPEEEDASDPLAIGADSVVEQEEFEDEPGSDG